MQREFRFAAVTLLSAATLAYEILLVRAIAIEFVHHLAYMAIGVAMLGVGASGTLFTLMRRVTPAQCQRWFGWTAVLAAIALPASLALTELVALDPTQALWDLSQWWRLAIVYVLLAMPFGLGALVTLLALVLDSDRTGGVYGASLIGSGLGGLIALAAAGWLLPDRSLAVPGVLAAIGSAAAVASSARSRVAPWLIGLVAMASVAAMARPPWHIDVSPFKSLPQVEALPDAERLTNRPSAVGWVAAVRAPAFRYAPGLSLAYRGPFPSQVALFVDGELAGSAFDTLETARDLFDWLPSSSVYGYGARPRVLVLGAGGGSAVWNAVLHGAERVTAVELHPELVRLQREVVGTVVERADALVEWIVGDPRSYAARVPQQFDVLAVQPTGGLGSSAGGVHALNEDFLHTVDAYAHYLDALDPGGIATVTRWLDIPPREVVRTVLTAGLALYRVSPATAPRGLVVLRSWATVTVNMKPDGFTDDEIADARTWAEQRQFDVDWYPGATEPTSQFHFLDEPIPFRAADAAARGPEAIAAFADSYPFAVAPVTDARPYPHHFLSLRSMGTLLASGPGASMPFAELGMLSVVATLVQSIVLASLLMVVPAALGTRRREGVGPRLLGYFSAIGVAYMVAEIAAIQQLSLLLGHPVYAIAAVLAAFLAASGAGSVWSDRLEASRARIVTSTIAALFLFAAVALLGVVHYLQSTSLAVRVIAGLLVVAPVAFLMGVPFALGMRLYAADVPARRAWAWAANGFASVVATPLAALLALELGSPALFLVAAGSYAVAALTARSPQLVPA